MRRAANFFKARSDMAVAISERTFRACEASPMQSRKQETIENFLARGGRITVIPPKGVKK